MKRLLLGPALALPLILGLCHLRTTTPEIPQLPKVPDVVREIPLDDFKAFPPVTPTPAPEPTWTPQAHTRSHAPARPHVQPKKPLRHAALPAPLAQAEPLPPQQGPICIFPLNMIPNCTPQAVGQ